MKQPVLALAALLMASSAHAQSTTLFSNSTTGYVGVGTTVPDSQFVVSSNVSAAPGTLPNDTLVHFMSADGKYVRVMMDTFGNSIGSVVGFRSAEGTAASPTATLSGDQLGGILGAGYGTTGYSPNSRASIVFLADQNWTDTAQGTDITFSTTADGTTTASQVMRITASGAVGIGTASPSGLLDIYGGHLIASRGGTAPSISACGTSPSISGTDNSFHVTMGTGTLTTCTINFGATWTTAPNSCVAFPANAAAAATGTTVARISAISTTQLTITGSNLTGASYYIQCF